MTDPVAKLIIDSLDIHTKVMQAFINAMRQSDFSSSAFLSMNDADEREHLAKNIALLLTGRGRVLTPEQVEAIREKARQEERNRQRTLGSEHHGINY